MYSSILVIFIVHLVSAKTHGELQVPDHCFVEATQILWSRLHPQEQETCPEWTDWENLYYQEATDEICLLPIQKLCVSASFCNREAHQTPSPATDKVIRLLLFDQLLR